jgi:hypothetical protein
MEVNVDASQAESQAWNRFYEWQQEAADARECCANEFLAACSKGDAGALADFAPMTTDWAKVKRPVVADAILPKRRQTLAEVLHAIVEWEFETGPNRQQLYQLLLNVASGKLPPEQLKKQAQTLLESAAFEFARQNA